MFSALHRYSLLNQAIRGAQSVIDNLDGDDSASAAASRAVYEVRIKQYEAELARLEDLPDE